MVITRLTRNQLDVCASRGFESHRLRHILDNAAELQWVYPSGAQANPTVSAIIEFNSQNVVVLTVFIY